MKTKKLYQTPLTERNVVELEGEFCGSIVGDAGTDQTIASEKQGFESIDASTTWDDGGAINGGGGVITWE